jgi:hypothetical protein
MVLTVGQAPAATQVYECAGWQLFDALHGSDGVHSLDPSGTCTIIVDRKTQPVGQSEIRQTYDCG